MNVFPDEVTADVFMLEAEVELPKVEEIQFTQFESPYSLADTGATTGVAGKEWLERVEQELSRYDMKPLKVKASQQIRGLGNAKRESTQ